MRTIEDYKAMADLIGGNVGDALRELIATNEALTASAKAGEALQLAVSKQMTIQVGRLDGTVVVTSNNDDNVYAAQVYLTSADCMDATVRAIADASVQIENARELRKSSFETSPGM